jgi:hypothetical protein
MRYNSLLAIAAVLTLSLFFSNPATAAAVPVELIEKDGAYRLFRGGQPYRIRGAGLEYSDVAVFTSHGGNSIRTWRTDNAKQTGLQVLDEAARHGITVALCIEIGRERVGFDYDDEQAVAEQLAYARAEVLKYKDHPALLTWIIGNEPNLFFKNPKVFDAINDMSKMIHEVDGQHPTTTALTGFNVELAELTETHMTDLDFISIQMYGDIVHLPILMSGIGYQGPYMVTEWGAVGHWEAPKTSWGAPVEQNSSEKADNYLKNYETAIASDPDQVMGSYVFLWGQKQERTPTWYGMLLEDGTETEAIDVMHYVWNGQWPDNRSPRVEPILLDSKVALDSIVLEAGGRYQASMTANDPDGDELKYRWEIMRESEASQEGGDKEKAPEKLPDLISHSDQNDIVIEAPGEQGEYRLFVYVYDGRGHAGHANIPFLVE